MDRERPLDHILEEYSIDNLREVVLDVAKRNSSIIGVLAIGSLMQTKPPEDFFTPRHEGRAGEAYEQIRRPERRKRFITSNSDLDLWICTRDTSVSETARECVDDGGAGLIEELASGTISRGTYHWRSKKLQAFDQYYKQEELYDSNEHEPWMAHRFKEDLEQSILKAMPGFVERMNGLFTKSIPGELLEVRAFPESLFNLRPDESLLSDGSEDRAPFPRIADDQWISTEHNAQILYASNDISIFPFKEDGEVLGSGIARHIGLLSEQEKRCLSQGGIMLKPDALLSQDIDIIRNKISESVAKLGGRIVEHILVERLTADDVKRIYPLLDPQDLGDVTEYLQSGPVEILIIELKKDPYETFKAINGIKGPRVGDRNDARLLEGRILDGGVRDLIPSPGDEDSYTELIPIILAKRLDPSVRFTKEQYAYYARNLIHTPDNSVELRGLKGALNKLS